MSVFAGPVFLVGMPRSGTKLLRGLLNEHSRVGIPLAETEFMPHWHAQWDRFGDLSEPARFSAFYQEVTGSAYFTYLAEEQGQRFGMDMPQPQEVDLGGCQQNQLFDFFDNSHHGFDIPFVAAQKDSTEVL